MSASPTIYNLQKKWVNHGHNDVFFIFVLSRWEIVGKRNTRSQDKCCRKQSMHQDFFKRRNREDLYTTIRSSVDVRYIDPPGDIFRAVFFWIGTVNCTHMYGCCRGFCFSLVIEDFFLSIWCGRVLYMRQQQHLAQGYRTNVKKDYWKWKITVRIRSSIVV